MAVFKQAQKLVGFADCGYQVDVGMDNNYYDGKLIGTNWGITPPVLAGYIGRSPLVEDMRSLSRTTAEEILRVKYWLKNNLNKLKNQSVANLIYDSAIEHGCTATRVVVEKALSRMGNPLDSYKVFTDVGIEFLNNLQPRKLFKAIMYQREVAYKYSEEHQTSSSWKDRLKRIVYICTPKAETYSKREVEHMQAWLLETAANNGNHRIIDRIITSGGIDGVMGRGFRSALDEAITEGFVTDVADLHRKSN